jgi:DNA polymerase-3 subunit gamma/tau
MGYDLRAVCRELSRVVRDLLVLTIDPARISDPEIAGETERDRLKALAARFSREDLLRAFDLLTRAEAEIRGAAQPRYHLEMAILRWIYLRKLAPIEELIAGTASGTSQSGSSRPSGRPDPSTGPGSPRATLKGEPVEGRIPQQTLTASMSRAQGVASTRTVEPAKPEAPFKDAFLAEIKKSKAVFYNMVVAQAQKIEIAGDHVTFTFSPAQRTLLSTLEQSRPLLEETAQRLAGGRKVTVVGVMAEAAAAPTVETPAPGDAKSSDGAVDNGRKPTLREQALADAGVQALLEVFPAEIRDVEEM